LPRPAREPPRAPWSRPPPPRTAPLAVGEGRAAPDSPWHASRRRRYSGRRARAEPRTAIQHPAVRVSTRPDGATVTARPRSPETARTPPILLTCHAGSPRGPPSQPGSSRAPCHRRSAGAPREHHHPEAALHVPAQQSHPDELSPQRCHGCPHGAERGGENEREKKVKQRRADDHAAGFPFVPRHA